MIINIFYSYDKLEKVIGSNRADDSPCVPTSLEHGVKAITDAEARIEDLANKIEEFTAQSARLNTEIKNHEKEVAENQATAIREKQLSDFNAEEKDLLESISALKATVDAQARIRTLTNNAP